ncbi:hypothetical protein KCP77_24100 [Salmonella enterica subsp. enterica]|nr:hypothetical protein KCP77_24100 [Salmonella enterica subsp. enterica]
MGRSPDGVLILAAFCCENSRRSGAFLSRIKPFDDRCAAYGFNAPRCPGSLSR